MSDFMDLLAGKLDPEQFIVKEWNNFLHLVETLPAELQPAAKSVQSALSTDLHAAADWAGTALSAYIAANSSGLQAAIRTLLQGAGLTTATGPALVDALQAVSALLAAMVANAVATFNSATPPPNS